MPALKLTNKDAATKEIQINGVPIAEATEDGLFNIKPEHRAYTPSNIIGTMESGAVIEQGSNANGEYVKFADGSMICWGFRGVVAETVSYTPVQAWSFPAAFLAPPMGFGGGGPLFLTGGGSGTGTFVSFGATALALQFRLYSIVNPFPVGAEGNTGVAAIGRWK